MVLNHCAGLLDHNNARFSCKYRTVQAGLNLHTKSVKSPCFFEQKGCLTIITLLRGPKIIKRKRSPKRFAKHTFQCSWRFMIVAGTWLSISHLRMLPTGRSVLGSGSSYSISNLTGRRGRNYHQISRPVALAASLSVADGVRETKCEEIYEKNT